MDNDSGLHQPEVLELLKSQLEKVINTGIAEQLIDFYFRFSCRPPTQHAYLWRGLFAFDFTLLLDDLLHRRTFQSVLPDELIRPPFARFELPLEGRKL